MSELTWLDDSHFFVGDINFRCSDLFSGSNPPLVTSPTYLIGKPKWRIDDYCSLLRTLKPKNIIEVGLLRGGGCIFLDAMCRPEKLVAIEHNQEEVKPLANYIESRDRSESIKIYYGLDQADVGGVSSLLQSEFGDRPLDLVIDDASHNLDETRTTFSVVFPFMRPGGIYIIEDWKWAHQNIDNKIYPEGLRPGQPPLTILAFELLLVLASTKGLIADIRFDRNSIFIQKGDAKRNNDQLVLADLYHSRGRDLLPKH
jgi:hypothetical protein